MSDTLVGCGGWAYFEVPGINSLEAYAHAFDFVEVNSSYYELPSVSTASAWRKRVPENFQFSVRCPRIIIDHYGLKLLPGCRLMMERVSEVCKRLDAQVLTVLVSKSAIEPAALASRLEEFLKTLRSGETRVAVELRNMNPNDEVFKAIEDSGAIHCIDISRDSPRFEDKTLYSRLFGKGMSNIYQFDDHELRDIASKAKQPKFEKSILAFHGVRMYQDAGRVKSFIEKGYFPRITGGVGADSIREILSEDAKFPSTKQRLLKEQGWKVFQDTDEVRKISTVLEKLPEQNYQTLDDLISEFRSHRDFFDP